MHKPDWWFKVNSDIDRLMDGFTDKLRGKLHVDPIKIIRRKNPFLFRVRSGDNPHELVRMVIDAYLSSSEETMFGNILEEIAISVCSNAKGGVKSVAEGIDLEYSEDVTRTIIQVKSGPNWGNSSQRKNLVDNFNSAQKRLRASGLNIRCVEGICYGSSQIKDYGSHRALIGKAFWEDISGWDGTPYALLESLEIHARNGLMGARDDAGKRFLDFLSENGVIKQNKIDWHRLLTLLL